MTDDRYKAELRNFSDGTVRIFVWCVPCDMTHGFTIFNEDFKNSTSLWYWNGSLEEPSFSPSLNLTYFNENGEMKRCHSYLENGYWFYHGDSTHKMKGRWSKLEFMPTREEMLS